MQSQSNFDQEKINEAYQLLMHSLRMILEDGNKRKTYQADQAEYYQSLFAGAGLFERFTYYLSVLTNTTLNLDILLKAIHHAKILCDKNQTEFSEINDVNKFIHHYIRDPVWDFHYAWRYPENKKISLGEGNKGWNDLPIEVWKKTMSFFSYQHRLLPLKLSCKTLKNFAEGLNDIPYSKLDYTRLIDSHTRNYVVYGSGSDVKCFVPLSEHEFLINQKNQLVHCDVRNSTKGAFGVYRKSKPMEGHEGSISSICVIPGEQKAASGSKDKTIRIWDLVENKCINVLQGHAEKINKVIMCKKKILSASNDKTLRIWDWKTGDSEVITKTENPIEDMVMINDHLIAYNTKTMVMVLDIEKKKCVYSCEYSQKRINIKSICLSTNNTLLVCLEWFNDDKSYWLHEVKEYSITEKMQLIKNNNIKLNQRGSPWLCFAEKMHSLPDGVMVFVGDAQLRFYSLNEKKFLSYYSLNTFKAYVSSLPDNRVVTFYNELSIFPFAHKALKNKVLEEKPRENTCTIS